MHKKKFMRFLAMTMAGAMVLTGVPIGLNSDGQIYSSVVEAKAEEAKDVAKSTMTSITDIRQYQDNLVFNSTKEGKASYIYTFDGNKCVDKNGQVMEFNVSVGENTIPLMSIDHLYNDGVKLVFEYGGVKEVSDPLKVKETKPLPADFLSSIETPLKFTNINDDTVKIELHIFNKPDIGTVVFTRDLKTKQWTCNEEGYDFYVEDNGNLIFTKLPSELNKESAQAKYIDYVGYEGEKSDIRALDFINYEEADKKVDISNLVSIEVVTPPLRTTYGEGDEFDPSGMVVVIKDDKGKSKKVNGTIYGFNNGEGICLFDNHELKKDRKMFM